MKVFIFSLISLAGLSFNGSLQAQEAIDNQKSIANQESMASQELEGDTTEIQSCDLQLAGFSVDAQEATLLEQPELTAILPYCLAIESGQNSLWAKFQSQLTAQSARHLELMFIDQQGISSELYRLSLPANGLRVEFQNEEIAVKDLSVGQTIDWYLRLSSTPSASIELNNTITEPKL